MRVIIAGTQTGCGKTTVAVGLMAALRRRGLKVQGYKIGPDYIDPMFHRLATGRPSKNLDPWLCGTRHVKAAADAECAVIEGVMGLFDGATARVAKLLDVPVILVFDAWPIGGSAAALVKGFRDYDPAVRVVGSIANRVAGPGHERILRDAVPGIMGAIPMQPELGIPERHLGLETERAKPGAWLRRLASAIESHVDVDRILSLPGRRPAPTAGCVRPPIRARIGIAEDRAFSFYYSENLDAIQNAGGELVRFSLLEGNLPEIDALYIGGGYPELHADELARNRRMKRGVREAIRRGLPVYAECGGLMYLSESLVDARGRRHEMAGAIPGRVAVRPRLQNFGYAWATALRNGPVLRRGETIRGHQFHTSERIGPRELFSVRMVSRGAHREGFATSHVHASYVHAHFAGFPQIPRRLVEAAVYFRERNP